MMEILSPAPGLLCKLVSVIVHAEELTSPDGHRFDADALSQLLSDPEVRAWIDGMTAAGLAPVKRK